MEKSLVLVVDDEPEARETISEVVAKEFLVETAESGKEALSKLKEKDFEVVLLDIRMPKMWGTEVLQKIKELKKPVEVIMLTALDDAQHAWESSKYGAFDYITKPFKNEDLLFRIKLAASRVIERRKTEEEYKSLATFFKIHDIYPKIYERIMKEFSKEMGTERIMTADEAKIWFSEKKLKEIFGSDFNEDWLKPQ